MFKSVSFLTSKRFFMARFGFKSAFKPFSNNKKFLFSRLQNQAKFRTFMTRSLLLSGGHDHHKDNIPPPDLEGKLPLVNPVPRPSAQITGMESAEAEGVVFDSSTALYGPFGTKDKPVIVRSAFDYRIVGCTGGNGKEHELLWHYLTPGRPLMCLDCGQFFLFEQVDKENHEHEHGHH